MTPARLALAAAALAAPWIATTARAQVPPDLAATGSAPLFNGRDLSGWHGLDPHKPPYDRFLKLPKDERDRMVAEWTEDAKAHWSVAGGELVNDGQGAYLATDRDYGDVELLIEYNTVAKADSGVYLRGVPQVQIWDATDEAKFRIGGDKGSGGLWNNSPGAPGKDPLARADRPFGEWNRLRILQVGARTTVHLNDTLVVDGAPMENYYDRSRPLPARGPIVLQTHGGAIRWRNIAVREVAPAEATALLARKGKDGDGFRPIFDGRSTDGWAGALDNYEVVDGALRCKSGQGGVLYFNEPLADFVARLEFRLPPGGNNGLAIRYPGAGDAAYAGMCELQVLDDDAPKYAKLDPRQAHGSAYGMAAAHRGYLRPPGEWNFQEVTVQGPTVKVELNGTVILDADLSKVTDSMAGTPHPGKDRTSGFFGFAGHDDPVAFRNVAIKPLGRPAPAPATSGQ